MKEKILKSNLFWIICIIIVWELVSRFNIVSSYVLPPFSKVFTVGISELKNSNILIQVLNSFKIVAIGIVISITLSLIVLIISEKFKNFKYFIRTICNVLSPLPSVAVLPLVVIWIGIKDSAMLVLVVHAILWPMIISLMEKIESIPTVYHEFLTNIECNCVKRVMYVYFLLILPGIIATLRIGFSRALRSIISSEAIFGMIGTAGGLGMYIYKNRAYGNLTKVMVGIVLIIIISIAIDKAFLAIERKTVRKWGMSYDK